VKKCQKTAGLQGVIFLTHTVVTCSDLQYYDMELTLALS